MAGPKYRWRRTRRVNTLPVPGSTAVQLVSDDPRRVALLIVNLGTGIAYLSEEKDALAAVDGFPIDANGGNFAPGTSPIAPQNEIFAVADAGHDLRISEIIDVGGGYV